MRATLSEDAGGRAHIGGTGKQRTERLSPASVQMKSNQDKGGKILLTRVAP